MFFSILVTIFCIFVGKSASSLGDHSPYYQKCVERCAITNCTETSISTNLNFLKWSCEDECRYDCMWKTVDAFHERKWKTPQFYGKWPFIRIFGIQEPASALFSMLNFYAHSKMLIMFRKEVPADSPFYYLWHSFSITNLNAWIWSTIFHTKDTPITEFMDYTCAFTVILISCYSMIIRLLQNSPPFVNLTVTTFFVAFLANHVAYLYMGGFDYGYNMKLNIYIGTFTAITWFGWSTYNRHRQPYAKKCALFVILGSLVTLLEIFDMPPILWTFDCHSLWHLATAPLICLFYSFVIDDCKYLRELQMKDKKVQ